MAGSLARLVTPVTDGRTCPQRVNRAAGFCVFAILVLCGRAAAGGISIDDDLFAGVWSPFGTRWQAEAPVCIWGDAGADVFQLIANGLSSGSDFRLGSSSDEGIRYRVFWRRANATGRGEELQAGIPSRGVIRGAAAPGCGGAANARIRVRIRKREVDRAPPGIYRDTLQLTLSAL